MVTKTGNGASQGNPALSADERRGRMEILAIDPGTTESAYVGWNGEDMLFKRKEPNIDVLWLLRKYDGDIRHLVIEEINPYTMGKTIRDTILWSGRFQEAWENRQGHLFRPVQYLSRNDVRQALCGAGSPKINDKVIKQALIDRFAYGQKNFGKGTKKEPGFFFGFSKDIWQAFALAVAFYYKEGKL